ncbi:MAG: hypothetical protein HY323_00275 [Betaproteobacteria bacterium]|nr:hypothetical protein [Betaproteobacteria bacterium]
MGAAVGASLGAALSAVGYGSAGVVTALVGGVMESIQQIHIAMFTTKQKR